MAAGPVLFGFATTMTEMVLYRFLAGIFSGAGLIIRTMIAEQTTSKTEAVAYSWFATADFLGAFIGPILGGSLADPVSQYPGIFRGLEFFERYPFALPGIVVGATNITGAITSAIFLEDTLGEQVPSSTPHKSKVMGAAKVQISLWQLTKIPGFFVALWVLAQVVVMSNFFLAILPVALYTPVSLGGLEYTPSQVSLYMAAQAMSQCLWFLLGFPWLQHCLGTQGVLRMCSICYPIFFTSYIFMNALLRDSSEISIVWFWIISIFNIFVGPAVFISYSAAQLIINNVSPDPRLLGRLNAVALMLFNMIRIAAPPLASALYAVGVQNHLFNGCLGWVVAGLLSPGLYFAQKSLPNSKKR